MEQKINKPELLATLKNRPDLSYAEIGRMFGISRQRVHQIAMRERAAQRSAKTANWVDRFVAWISG